MAANVWEKVFVWWIVRTSDEGYVAFQHVWRRREDGRWEYKTFRSEQEKEAEFWDNQW